MTTQFSTSLIFTLLLYLLPNVTFAQKAVEFVGNPSFESPANNGAFYDIDLDASFIDSWTCCGHIYFPLENKPDIHSATTTYFGINHPPSEGSTFLGLTVREDGSWESITQQFIPDLEEGNCYKFTIDLSKPSKCESTSRLNNELQKPYDGAVALKIWASEYLCDTSQLLFESPPIDHEEWKSYEVNFQFKSNFDCLVIQSYFIEENKPYNGYILVDNISKLTVFECLE